MENLGLVKPVRAIISVTDKRGIVEFAAQLAAYDIEVISTGGTARALKAAKVPVTEVSDFTGLPEMMDGRVKTLHHKVSGGILYKRDNAEHIADAQRHDILGIDIVVVNLYDFASAARDPEITLDKLVEQIDIGGPTMIRAAAKNWRAVTVVVYPTSYETVLAELSQSNGFISPELRYELAYEAIAYTAQYDSAIRTELASWCADGTREKETAYEPE